MKKYSFVIPTYQRKVLLKNTLEVLNRQQGYGRDDYEVILADDGSTDGTEEFVKGVNRNYELKYIYLERPEESCRARPCNAGWKAAEGEILVFIDCDILVKENYLKELDRCFSLEKELYPVNDRRQLEERHFKYFLSFSYNSCFQG